ncbi:MAG: hypothetical protein HS115_05000 [Spirochaetales bacterium]|nr:hypothetical protein [Spirochaetales bacterium]
MKRLTIFFIVLASLSLLNCFSMGSVTGIGPQGFLFNGVTIGTGATSAQGNKVGQACSHTILMLVAVGDASIKEAAVEGQITNITSVDRKFFSLLGPIFTRACTVVRGD